MVEEVLTLTCTPPLLDITHTEAPAHDRTCKLVHSCLQPEGIGPQSSNTWFAILGGALLIDRLKSPFGPDVPYVLQQCPL